MNNIHIQAISYLAHIYILKNPSTSSEKSKFKRWPFWIFERIASWQNSSRHFRSQVGRHIQQARNTLPEYNANIDTECVLCSQRDRAKQRNHVLSCT